MNYRPRSAPNGSTIRFHGVRARRAWRTMVVRPFSAVVRPWLGSVGGLPQQVGNTILFVVYFRWWAIPPVVLYVGAHPHPYVLRPAGATCPFCTGSAAAWDWHLFDRVRSHPFSCLVGLEHRSRATCGRGAAPAEQAIQAKECCANRAAHEKRMNDRFTHPLSFPDRRVTKSQQVVTLWLLQPERRNSEVNSCVMPMDSHPSIGGQALSLGTPPAQP